LRPRATLVIEIRNSAGSPGCAPTGAAHELRAVALVFHAFRLRICAARSRNERPNSLSTAFVAPRTTSGACLGKVSEARFRLGHVRTMYLRYARNAGCVGRD